jgi:hypothetical protein
MGVTITGMTTMSNELFSVPPENIDAAEQSLVAALEAGLNRVCCICDAPATEWLLFKSQYKQSTVDLCAECFGLCRDMYIYLILDKLYVIEATVIGIECRDSDPSHVGLVLRLPEGVTVKPGDIVITKNATN